jgi:phosphopantothenoylcysteine decarboxylase/phosphopantothenate--cysteine ligase
LDTFSEDDPSHVAHVDMADWSDFAVIAPATANILAKMSHGIADNFVTSALLATTAPVFVIPAMNSNMLNHPATQESIATLKSRGIYFVEPDTGFLAEGYEGKGRYPENKRIVEEFESFVLKNSSELPLSGKRILVSAGGTKERLDPVRYITNDSSGKMGHEVAREAYIKGAAVTLVTASDLEVSAGIEVIRVDSASEMFEEIDKRFEEIDILIMSAAVSDYRAAQEADEKVKKEGTSDVTVIELTENPDILKTMGEKKTHQFLVGFAAETSNLESYAKEKLKEKNLDMIVGNEVGHDDRGFDSDHNEVVIITKEGQHLYVPKTTKKYIANILVDKIVDEMRIK